MYWWPSKAIAWPHPSTENRHTQTSISTTSHTTIQKCLRPRAKKVCRGSDITWEKEHLLDVFVANGYPEDMTQKALVSKERKRGGQTEENERMDKLYIPYLRGLNENIKKALKDLEARTVFKTNLTLRHHLTKVKTQSDPITTKGVV